MGLLPAIASTILYAIPAGPIGLVWVGSQTACSPNFQSVKSPEGMAPGRRFDLRRWLSHGMVLGHRSFDSSSTYSVPLSRPS